MPGSPIPVVHRRNMSKKRMEDVLEKRSNSSSSSCSNFYVSPSIGETVNALDPLPITWDPTCLSAPAIDIYLYAPGAAVPRIHVWEGIALSRGTYNATLMPRWWNSTSSQSLQITIVVSGQAPFLSTLPVGPVFNATYTPPASGTPPSADTSQVSSGITQVNDLANSKNALTPGKKAAAALLTLLFFIGLAIAAYIRFKRMKGRKARRRWSEAVDKRMSTISTEWKSVSVAGANAAIRNSMAVGNRSSAFSFGGIRPSSTLAVENEDEKRPVSQMRTGVGLRNPSNPLTPTERVSRVSFAPDTRISRASTTDSRLAGESRRTRAFHTGYVPPVPSLPDTADPEDSDSGSLSPRQSEGPLTLTPEDIRARIAANKRSRSITPSEISNAGNDIDEVMPALRMMRTGNDPSVPDDFLLNPPEPVHVATSTSPTPQHTTPVMPMEPIPANVMSPDEMLRQYAERKKSMAAGTHLTSSSSLSSIGSVNYPKAVVKKRSIRASLKGAGSNTMRVLYNATRSLSPTNPTGSPTISHHTISSVYEEEAAHEQIDGQPDVSPFEETENESENMAGLGTANPHPFGYHPNAYTGYAIGDDDENENAGQGAVHFGHAS